ncbi:MAG: hypothetical protein JNL90_15680 [Planctomycetes bacterium]|nr:hypothetical protein [Planctomycetota bacterium]
MLPARPTVRAATVAALLAAIVVPPSPARSPQPPQGRPAAERVPVLAPGAALSFEEEYALSDDRAAVVARLVPGTAEWSYWSCRERLDAGDFAAVKKLLEPWRTQHGRSQQLIEIENRLALQDYAADPERTLRFLRERLGYGFDHQREVPGERSDLPTRLDPALLAPATQNAAALARHPGSVDGFTDRALAGLAAAELTAEQRRSWLARLDRPDVANLPSHVVRDLAVRGSGGFGSLPIHRQLRREQLDECARLDPTLLSSAPFVDAYLARLAPSVDRDWLADPSMRAAQLARLAEFAARLPAAFNSVKAQILFHQLQHDLTQGAPDKARFLAYLRLPRRDGPREPRFARQFRPEEQVDSRGRDAVGLPPIGDDEPLLRACLERFFATEETIAPYAELLDSKWLERVLAETKLLLGQGDAERWVALLGNRDRLAELERRVELSFPPTQPLHFAPADPVRIELDTKNVPTLLVKVWAIDAWRYCIEQQRDPDASIELDGIVANHEQALAYAEPPLRRVRRTIDLPMIDRAGVFVVEFVGNGLSSRAVIRKGGLRHAVRATAAGPRVRLFDEAGKTLPDASLWFGGREYAADADGEILLPFASEAGRKNAVVRHGELATVVSFDHRAESYALACGVHVEREALVAGQLARLVLRPQLALDGHPVSLALLSDLVLTVTAVDLDGVATPQEVRGLALVDERELVHELRVPERLATLQVALRAKVRDLAGKEIDLAPSPSSFAVNGIDATAANAGVQLVRGADGYALEVRGKEGEPKGGHACQLTLHHRDYRAPIEAALQSDAAGRLELGLLPGIDALDVRLPSGFVGTFALARARVRTPLVLHGLAGETLRLPYGGTATAPTRAEFSLLGGESDHFAALSLADGFLELRGLAAGDYELRLHETGDRVRVRVTAGRREGAWLVGAERLLQASPTRPLQLRNVEASGDELVVRVANASAATRLLVAASRFDAPFDPWEALARVEPRVPQSAESIVELSSYHSGRRLGDEYRYVLERRFQPKFAGNMLRRPSLLLNPWALDEESENDSLGVGDGSGGFGAARKAARGGGAAGKRRGEEREAAGPHPGAYANVDWLPRGAVVLANLVPGADGVVRVKRADLGDAQRVAVVALDGEQALAREIALPAAPLVPRPRRLAAAIDGARHFVQSKRIEFLEAGATATLLDGGAAEVEVHDSLSAAWRLLQAISGDGSLTRFAFLLEWPKLAAEEKRELYGANACHELAFFLSRKDPAFFAEVVQPSLAHKKAPTFLDRYLLGEELQRFLEPTAFARLHLIERLLLAERLGGAERASVARLVREQHELVPLDRQRADRLFDLALRVNDLREELPELLKKLQAPVADAAQAAPPAGAPGAPTGGGGRAMRPATAGAPAKGDAPAESRAEHEKEEAKFKDAADDKNAQLDELRSLGYAEDGEGGDRERAGLVEELSRELSDRRRAQRLYRGVDATRLLIEHDYWHRDPREPIAGLVAPNLFWLDYALRAPERPFVSPSVVEASGSLLEMLFALALLDLPFEAGKHEVVAGDGRRTLRAATPLLLVRKELEESALAADAAPLLIGQNFFRVDDRWRYEGSERRDAFVTGEFLADVAYGCQVVVTNPTSSARTAEVLLQVPAGAIPVARSHATRSVVVALAPYATQALEYAFYFPVTGRFAHYPAHASEGGKLAAFASPRTLDVVARPTTVDTTSWEHVSQQGSAAEVLAFLDRANLQRHDLARIAWRMKERDFFAAAIAKLRAAHRFDATLWSYALVHGDVAALRELLRANDGFVAACGGPLQSPLLDIDPVERGSYRHLELDPLVLSRAHPFAGERKITNGDLAGQWSELTRRLSYLKQLGSEEWLEVTYYLALQDRVAEALAAFARVDAAQVREKLQHDYLAAYLGFFTGDVATARALAERHRDHPLPHWRARFADVLAQLDEAAGKARVDEGVSGDALAARAPALDLVQEGGRFLIRSRNLARCEVRCYPLDVEFAFSSQPFAAGDGAASIFVQPSLRETRDLPAAGGEIAFELPDALRTRNVRVEVRAGGLARSRTWFSNALDVQFLESFGQVAVTEPGSRVPLARTYVKCFAKLRDGTVRFHKDGYTDLRGRFDYASVSDDPDAGAMRYAVLVLHDERGAVIREVAPPAR